MSQQNTPTILKQIVADKQAWIAHKQAEFPLESFKSDIQPSDRDFYRALQTGVNNNTNAPAYILECKKASPSKGLIRADFSPTDIAKVYKNYASAISVLTDEKYFQGDFEYIKQVRKIAHQPILCKDFIISPYQVYLARYHQADAILLMLSLLTNEQYRLLSELAHGLGMGVLTESATKDEVQRAIELNAKVMGINNRNLHDLSVDITRTSQLAQSIPKDKIIISESGIKNHQHIKQIQPYANAFLIGSSLMAEDDLNAAVRRIVFGENKVCGLTNSQDAKHAYEVGAYFGGLIFAEKSKRKLSLEQAKQIVNASAKAAPLHFVGVFQNQTIEQICKVADLLNLFAVQLHGDEDKAFVNELRKKLANSVQIWKAISVDMEQTEFIIPDFVEVDRFVIDSKVGSQQGGTGKVFDWSLVPTDIKAKSMLAGGLNIDNIAAANAQGFIGLDINSGAESSVGVKDLPKLKRIFQTIL